MLSRFEINEQGSVDFVYPDGSRKTLPKRRGGTKKSMLSLLSISSIETAKMYYFLLYLLGLPLNKWTVTTGNALLRAGITPEILCSVEIGELRYFVKRFGTESVTRLEKAIKSH
jgi:hypothetical protein